MTKNHKTTKTKNSFSDRNPRANHHKALGQNFTKKTSAKNFTKPQFQSQNKANSTNIGDKFSNNSILICGKHAVFTAIKANKRKIYQVFVTQNLVEELNKFLENSNQNNLKSAIKIVSRDDLNRLFPDQQSHQGIAANCSKTKLKTQFDLLSELHNLPQDSKLPTLLLLDQIVDPQNVGAIIRSAVSFGIKDIVFCEHNSVIENATVVKSSVGTIEFAELTVVSNFSNLMEKLKKIGYWCVGLCGEATQSIEEIKQFKNVAIVVGSEGNGIRDLVKKNCDFLAKINIDPQVESLNASVACAITLYEISKLTKL